MDKIFSKNEKWLVLTLFLQIMSIFTKVFEKGIITRTSAIQLYKTLFQPDHKLDLSGLNELHVVFYAEDFDYFRDLPKSNLCTIRKKSNCKLQLRQQNRELIQQQMKGNVDQNDELLDNNKGEVSTTTIFLYKDMPGTTFNSVDVADFEGQKISLEYIVDVYCSVMLKPLIDLRNCNDLDEAMICWSLNKQFFDDQENEQDLIDIMKHQIKTCGLENLQKTILLQKEAFKSRIVWFLNHKHFQAFVPMKFQNRVKKLWKSRRLLSETSVVEFLDIMHNIHSYFVKKVKTYFNKNIKGINIYDLEYKIELYGKREPDETGRISLFFEEYRPANNEQLVHYKSTAILNNLRWFFNTRFNSRETFGLDGEFGRGLSGYGQTFHKYEDMILFLVSHPNTVKHCELVVLDPIPENYIF